MLALDAVRYSQSFYSCERDSGLEMGQTAGMGVLAKRTLRANAANRDPVTELMILKGSGVARLFGE